MIQLKTPFAFFTALRPLDIRGFTLNWFSTRPDGVPRDAEHLLACLICSEGHLIPNQLYPV